MKTILIIEDTLEMRENITEILQLAPYQVVQAANGKEGVELARETCPDLILCDIMMPDLDGFGVLHILDKDPILADVPFIFLTAKAEPADFRFGMNLGADDYLTKPFNALTLLNTVELRLRKSERRQPVSASTPTGLDKLTQAILNQEDAHQALCENYPTTHYNRKHRLFTTDSWPTALYFISRGKVKLFKTDAAGNEYITALLGTGDFAGYHALLEETAYSETAEVIDNAEVCTIPKADFLALIHHNHEVANQIIRVVAGDVAEHRERLLKLAHQSVRRRVAEALLMVQLKFYAVEDPTQAQAGNPLPLGSQSGLSRPANGSGKPSPNTSLPMTLSRENWSHLVGASAETVIRVLSDFRAEGLISLSASQITLLDIDKLTRLKH